MATSGSTNYSRNALQVITAALRKLRVIDAGTSASGSDLTTGIETLNLMVKSWALDGVFLWLVQEAVLHLQKNGQSYSLGPTGDHFCAASDAVKTQLSAAGVAAATALTVDDNTGISNGDYIGVELDDGTLHWDVQDGAPAGTTDITLTTGLASAASADSYVFAYTSKLARPTEILEVRLRNVDNNDTPVVMEPSTTQYWQRDTDKTATGDCRLVLYDPHITNGTLYTYPACDDVTDRLFMTIRRVIEDFDATTDDPDMPVECYEALIWNLAIRLAPEYVRTTSAELNNFALYSYGRLHSRYARKDPVQFVPPKYLRRRR